MLNPAITEYLIASRTDEIRREAAGARLARAAADRPLTARPARQGHATGAARRWRAWGLSVTPRAFG
jgi:hypothetical protein